MTEQSGPGMTGALQVLYVEDYAPSVVLTRDSLMRRAPDIHLDVVATVGQAIERLQRFEAQAAPGQGATFSFTLGAGDTRAG